MHIMKALVVLLILMLANIAAIAQTYRVTGQVRERSEYASLPDAGGDSYVFHLLRTRLALGAAFDDELSIVAELQDARRLGDDPRTFDDGIPAFDLRQGYIEARHIGGSPIGVKVGRQVLAYANERLLGAEEWSNHGQWFDAAVIRTELNQVTLDLLGGVVARLPDRPVYTRDLILIGAWGSWIPDDSLTAVQAFYLFDNPTTSVLRQNRHTLGMHAHGERMGFDYELDAAIQLGDHFSSGSDVDRVPIDANLIGIRLGYTIAPAFALRLGIGYDRLSGNAPGDADSYGAFHTLYDAGHRYYGMMGLFADVPQATRGSGLQDVIAQVSASPFTGIHLGADLHIFSLAEALANAAEYGRGIGSELDIRISGTILEWLVVEGGWSIFTGDDARYIPAGSGGGQWGYFMATATF